MKKEMVAFACFVLAATTILTASPASAVIVTDVSDTSVQVSNVSQPFSAVLCDGAVQVSYLQRMKIGGHWRMIPTEFTYVAGKHELTVMFTCSDGSNVYGLSPCQCLTAVGAAYHVLAQPAFNRLIVNASAQLVGTVHIGVTANAAILLMLCFQPWRLKIGAAVFR